MDFLNGIVNRLNDVSGWFYQLYLDVYYAGWPLDILADWFYALSNTFNRIAWNFSDFGTWVLAAQAKIVTILDWSTIWSYILSYVPNLTDIRDWFYSWTSHVWGEIDTWWTSTMGDVLSWIADVESWTQGQLNSLRDLIIALIADVEAWTTAQLNSLQSTFITLISNVEAWTTTQINDLQDTFNTLIFNVEMWTTTQLNNVRDALLVTFGTLETWTQTQINTMQATITTLIDWAALNAWITGWWNDRLLDVQDLIGSAFVDREPFWADWQDWRDSVAEFFTDPEDWLYKSVDRIIERFW